MTHSVTSHRLHRRAFMGASAAAVAGISIGADLGASKRAHAQDGGEALFQAAWPYAEPPTGHFNVLGSGGIMGPPNIYGDLIWLPLALYTWTTREWMPILATNWGFVAEGTTLPAEPESSDALTGLGTPEQDATIFQVRLREGANWSDGTPITSADLLTTTTIMRMRSNVLWSFLDDVVAVDDTTVNFVMSRPSSVVQRYVLRTSPQSQTIYGEWADRANELFVAGTPMTDDTGRQLLNEFNEFRPDSIVASGPFTIDVNSITNAELSMVRNDAAFNADAISFDRIRNFNGFDDSINAVILNGDVDYATQSFPPAVEDQLVAAGQRIIRPPVYTGPAVLMNYGRWPQLADKRVRQAFAHVIDREENGFVALGESGVPVRYVAGISEATIDLWLEPDVMDSLNTYEWNHDEAERLLTEAGWEKNGDTWIMADGTEPMFEVLIPAESPDWSAAGQNTAEQLTFFGINCEVRAVPVSQQSVDTDDGNFDLSIRYWGNSGNPHPHFSFLQEFVNHNTAASNGVGMDFPLTQETDVAGEVDIHELILRTAEGLDEDAQRADIATMCQIYNELLPNLPLFERYGNNSILEDVRVNPWPADDDPIYMNSPYADGIVTMFMLRGNITPVGTDTSATPAG